jgi:hypothetical protein
MSRKAKLVVVDGDRLISSADLSQEDLGLILDGLAEVEDDTDELYEKVKMAAMDADLDEEG